MALISFPGSPHGGSHKLLPEWNRQPRITPTTIIDHSIVGSALGAWHYFRDRTGIESHFIVRGAEQLRAGFGGVHPGATGPQVRASQVFIVKTLLDIQAKLDQLLGQSAQTPDQSGETTT